MKFRLITVLVVGVILLTGLWFVDNWWLLDTYTTKPLGTREVKPLNLGIFHPQTHRERFLHALAITESGVIADFNSDASGILYFHPLPQQYFYLFEYEQAGFRQYTAVGQMKNYALQNFPSITEECIANTSINLLTTAVQTNRGPGKVANNLISILRELGINPVINDKDNVSKYTTNVILDYWGNHLYDQALFINGLSPNFNESNPGTFFIKTAVFLGNSTTQPHSLTLIDSKFVFQPIDQHKISDYTPCNEAFLMVAYALADGGLLQSRAKELQDELLSSPYTKPESQAALKYWEALSEFQKIIQQFNTSYNISTPLIHVLNTNGEQIEIISLLDILKKFVWTPQLNYMGNSCGYSNFLKTLPQTRNFPILTFPVGVDTKQFYPTSRYWSSERKKKAIVYIKRFDERERVDIVLNYLSRITDLSVSVFQYGSYNEQEFVAAIRSSQFAIIFDGGETQGFALQEMMSMDLPLFVYQFISTPYFSPLCGHIFITEFPSPKQQSDKALEDAIQVFLSDIDEKKFSPREYIAEYLSFGISGVNFLQYVCHWQAGTSCGQFVNPIEIPACQGIIPVWPDFSK